MKKTYFILLFFIFIRLVTYSQVTVLLSICGPLVLNYYGTDGTGRNIYHDGTGAFSVQWSTTANEWEIVQLPAWVGYSNTYASAPDPPCMSTGTWQLISQGCGNVIGFSGNCQSSITGVEYLSMLNEISVFPNPGNGQFNFAGLENENSIEIFDFTGRLILQTISNNSLATIDLSGKDKGMYLYRVTDKINKVRQGKLSVL